MGSLLRSEEMSLCQLYIQSEAAYFCVSELGELGLVQFKDMNSEVNSFLKPFVGEIRRCDEMERQLRYFEKEMHKEGVEVVDKEVYPDAPAPKELVDMEAMFSTVEGELKQLHHNQETLKKQFVELTELKYVLKQVEDLLRERSHSVLEDAQESIKSHQSSDDVIQMQEIKRRPPNEEQQAEGSKLSFVAGVINRERMASFERLLWIASRGKVFMKWAEIEEEIENLATGELTKKAVFSIFLQGPQLRSKVKKICEGFRASLYPCPEEAEERYQMSLGVISRLEELKMVLGTADEQITRVLGSVAQNWLSWFIKVRKVKAIYHTLNMFLVQPRNYVAECWCRVADIPYIQTALNRGGEVSGSSAPSVVNRVASDELPTKFMTNKYSSAFQAMVDAYGVPTYQEINPVPFTMITFPFLFGVMFGDAGHGLIMLLFAIWMVRNEAKFLKQKSDNEIWNILFAGRYIVLLMGIFSIYAGFIYNDVFSKSMNIFGSSWRMPYNKSTILSNPTLQLDPASRKAYTRSPYPFGIDPLWQMAKNKLNSSNSFKKKISVILGVIQMLFGVILSLLNHRHYRKPLNIISEFVPQVIFLVFIFGYLVILIFYKWFAFSAATSTCSPNLLVSLINMFFFKYDDAPTSPCSTRTFYPGQKSFQIFLVLSALACVPWMLLVKPLYLRRQHQIRQRMRLLATSNNTEDTATSIDREALEAEEITQTNSERAKSTQPQEQFDFQEAMVHQSIHTIEYCLGVVSNTASYLRLWALSLAHSQLSEVLWNMVLRMGLGMGSFAGGPILAMGFSVWAVLTIAILVLMEGLSAFLHALRLHWVEFQSKFYIGTGFPFVPFDLKEIVHSLEE